MRIYLTLILICLSSLSFAQPNCNYFLYTGDTTKYEACNELEKADKYYQFSKEFQQVFDNSIEIDSTFAYAYREKSVAYLKSGDFLEWKRLIDLAVKYNPLDNLGYRASCSFQFFRSYNSAIADIEKLSKMTNEDIGHSADGVYHLEVVRALSYRSLGQKQKAIDIMEKQLAVENYIVGIYDYIHLGVLYLETDNLQKAKDNFIKQEEYNDLAENHFYMARALKAEGKMEEAKLELDKTEALFKRGIVVGNGYVYPKDKIYLSMIDKEKEVLGY